MVRKNTNQYPEDYFEYYGTVGYKGTYVPYQSDGKIDKLSYFQTNIEYGNFTSVSDGFDPYSKERYAREIGYGQGRYNHGQNSYAKYKDMPGLRPIEPPKTDWAHIFSVIICLIALFLTAGFVVDKYLDGDPSMGVITEGIDKLVNSLLNIK